MLAAAHVGWGRALRADLAVGIGVCLLMAGCGALPKVVSANESRVIVRGGTAQEATDLAVKACARYGKTGARFSHAETWTFWFDCI